mgnify:CR=1 FL=1
MLLSELDAYFRSLMDFDRFERLDGSLNGLQVGRRELDVTRVAFAVDASLETFRRAVGASAQMLFVHHGLFWGRELRVEGVPYDRLKFLIEHDLALYAAHLPLDLHPEFGNNIGIAAALGLSDVEPFGLYHGVAVGFKGVFERPRRLQEIASILFGSTQENYGLLPFGPELVRTVGIISGSGTREAEQAITQGLDLFITGEISHQIYHPCLEAGITVLAAGHYRTEVWGVRQLAEKLARERNVETVFIDVPTGL